MKHPEPESSPKPDFRTYTDINDPPYHEDWHMAWMNDGRGGGYWFDEDDPDFDHGDDD